MTFCASSVMRTPRKCRHSSWSCSRKAPWRATAAKLRADLRLQALSRILEPLQRLGHLGLARLCLFAFFLFFFDHFFRGPRSKIGIVELGVDAGNVGVGLGHFLGEASALGVEIDHALEWQRRGFTAHDKLH